MKNVITLKLEEGRSNGLMVLVVCSFEPLPHTPDGVR
jgi:hypothetical protein